MCAAMPVEKMSLPANTHPSAIAVRMKLTREALSLRPVDICRLTGIAPNAYSQYESGGRRINLDDGMRWAFALNLSLDWLYCGKMGALPLDAADKLRKHQKSIGFEQTED